MRASFKTMFCWLPTLVLSAISACGSRVDAREFTPQEERDFDIEMEYQRKRDYEAAHCYRRFAAQRGRTAIAVYVPKGEHLAWLRDEPQLESLLLRGRLDSADLQHLRCLTKLRSLTFVGVSLDSLRGVAELSSLESIGFRQDCWISGDWAEIARMPRLQGLELAWDSGYSSELISTLDKLSSLKSLSLSGPHLLDKATDHLATIARVTTLEELHLSGRSVDLSDLTPLKSLVNLRGLSLRGYSLNSDGLAVLAGLRKLKRLSLGLSNQPTDEDLQLLAQSRSLQEVNVHQFGISLDGDSSLDYWVPDGGSNVMSYIRRLGTMSESEKLACALIREYGRKRTEYVNTRGASASLSLPFQGVPGEWTNWRAQNNYWDQAIASDIRQLAETRNRAVQAINRAFSHDPDKLKRALDEVDEGRRQ